jgi:hypothetical protein
VILEPEKKNYLSTYQHWYICPITLPVRRNPQHTSILTDVPATPAPPFQLLHQRKRLPLSCEPLYATNTSHRKQQIFLYENPLHWVSLPTEHAQQNAAPWQYTKTQSSFWLLKPASEHVHARLLPRLSRSWAVLLPSDVHREPITSITAVLLPFVTYLLTLPRTSHFMAATFPESKCKLVYHFISVYRVKSNNIQKNRVRKKGLALSIGPTWVRFYLRAGTKSSPKRCFK